VLKISSYKKDIATLAGGTGVSQVIHVISMPFLMTLYSPEAFGEYAFLLFGVNIFSAVSMAQYDKAVLVTRSDIHVTPLIFICLVFHVLAIALVVLTIILIIESGWKLHPLLADYKNTRAIVWVLFILMSRNMTILLQAVLNRIGRYGMMALLNIVRTLSFIILAWGIAWYDGSEYGLVKSEYLTSVIMVLLTLYLGYRICKEMVWTINKEVIKECLLLYKQFPLYSVVKSIFFIFTTDTPLIILGKYGSLAAAGHYSIATRVLGKPIALLARSTLSVYRREIALETKNHGTSINAFNKTLWFQIKYSLPIFIGFVLLIVILGNKYLPLNWINAIPQIQILSIMFAANLIVSPIAYNFVYYNRQREDLLLNIAMFLFTNISLWILLEVGASVNMSVGVYVIVYTMFYIVYYVKSKAMVTVQ